MLGCDKCERGSDCKHGTVGGNLRRVSLATLLDHTRGAKTFLGGTDSRQDARAREVDEQQDAPFPAGEQRECADDGRRDRSARAEDTRAASSEGDRDRDEDGDCKPGEHFQPGSGMRLRGA